MDKTLNRRRICVCQPNKPRYSMTSMSIDCSVVNFCNQSRFSVFPTTTRPS